MFGRNYSKVEKHTYNQAYNQFSPLRELKVHVLQQLNQCYVHAYTLVKQTSA